MIYIIYEKNDLTNKLFDAPTDNDLRELNRIIEDRDEEIDRLNNEITQYTEVQNKNDHLSKKVFELNNDLESLKKEYKAITDEYNQSKTYTANLENKLTNSIDTNHYNKILEDYKSERQVTDNLKSKLAFIKDENEHKKNRINELNVNITEYQKNIESKKKEIESFKRDIKDKNNDINILNSKMTELNNTINELTKTIESHKMKQMQDKAMIKKLQTNVDNLNKNIKNNNNSNSNNNISNGNGFSNLNGNKKIGTVIKNEHKRDQSINLVQEYMNVSASTAKKNTRYNVFILSYVSMNIKEPIYFFMINAVGTKHKKLQ